MIGNTERSLLHFCKNTDISLDDLHQNLSTVKKQIQLEFKAAKNGIIVVDGLEYDSNFILTEIENPRLTDTLHFDANILSIPWLDDFINRFHFSFADNIFSKSYSRTDFSKHYYIPEEVDSPEFREYISPKMAKSFNTLSRYLLEEDLFLKQKILMNLIAYIKPNDYELAFQYIRLMLNDSIKVIRNSNKDNYIKKGNELERWTINSAGAFINSLPEGFSGGKNEFVRSVVNFSVDIQHKDKRMAYRLSSQLINIEDISHELKKTVRDNHVVLKRRYEGVDEVTTKKSNEISPWTFLYLFIILIKFMVLFGRC
jgi:hypothetical protein